MIDTRHPEFLPLVSHFVHVVEELKDRTNVVTNSMFEGEDGTAEAVGATSRGLEYLMTKCLLQTSTALHVGMYLMLKASQQEEDDGGASMEAHPVMDRLHRLNKLLQQVEDKVETKELEKQMTTLVQASHLITDTSITEEDEEEDEESVDEEEEEMMEESKTMETERIAMDDEESSNDDSDSDDDDNQDILQEARFALRTHELVSDKSRIRRAAPDDNVLIDSNKAATKALASTINSIQQRSATRNNKRKKPKGNDEDVEDEEEFERGLAMMEADIGKDSDQDDVNHNDDRDNNNDEDDEDKDDFYETMANRSRAKKEYKKAKYAVLPKYPTVQHELEGERPIGRTIMKNRGLVAHKNKLNRNPRVKKREQYRKAVIRRKGAVRDVRTDEGHRYGGEETGIKSGLSRSRKLGVR